MTGDEQDGRGDERELRDDERARSRWPRRPSIPATVSAGLLYALLGSFLVTDARLAEGRWVAFIAVLLAGAWAFARLIDRALTPPDPHRRRATVGWVAISFVAWNVLLEILRSLWLAIDVPVTLIGDWERLLLAPIVVLALLAIGARLRLQRWITALFAGVAVVGLFSDSVPSDWPTELVAAAGPAELQTALRDDQTIALRTARHDRGAPVAPIPRIDGLRCQRIEVRDQRRTLIGMPAGRTRITSDTCWRADGRPFAVRVIASTDAEDSTATPQAVQVLGSQPFDIGGRDSAPIVATPPDPGAGDPGINNIHPFADDGRVRLGSGADRPVLVRVGRKGREVEILLGWLRGDPLLRSSSVAPGRNSDGRGNSRFVELGAWPNRNEDLDVFAVTGRFDGGPDARFERLRPGGTSMPAASDRSTGLRSVKVGADERQLVVLSGGR